MRASYIHMMKNEIYRPSLARIKNAKSPYDLYCEVSNAICCYNDGEYIHSKSLLKRYIVTIINKMKSLIAVSKTNEDKEILREIGDMLRFHWINDLDELILGESDSRRSLSKYGGTSAKSLLERYQLFH